jgi:hypothetical protein
MPYHKLSIPQPCQQNWDHMAPVNQGRHCGACSQVIVDFSALSNQELITVLQTQKPHCGRFNEDQMGTLFYIGEQKRERKKYWSSIAAAIVAGVLQLSAGYGQQPKYTQKLFSRYLATGKFPLDPSGTETKRMEEKKLVNIMVQNSEWQIGVGGIKIFIDGLGIEGITDHGGSFMFELPDDINLHKKVTIRLENPGHIIKFAKGYSQKNLRVQLKDLVNQTKIILLQGKKRKNIMRTMGLIAYENTYLD